MRGTQEHIFPHDTITSISLLNDLSGCSFFIIFFWGGGRGGVLLDLFPAGKFSISMPIRYLDNVPPLFISRHFANPHTGLIRINDK